jgi:hypothetical protein
MREVVREILARRAPEPPAEFLAVQISRLSEALLVSYSAMSGGNLQAVDRVVKIVRALDRYHGFAAVKQDNDVGASSRRRSSLPWRSRRLIRVRLEMAPHPLEKSRFATGNGAPPLIAAHGRQRGAARFTIPLQSTPVSAP